MSHFSAANWIEHNLGFQRGGGGHSGYLPCPRSARSSPMERVITGDDRDRFREGPNDDDNRVCAIVSIMIPSKNKKKLLYRNSRGHLFFSLRAISDVITEFQTNVPCES